MATVQSTQGSSYAEQINQLVEQYRAQKRAPIKKIETQKTVANDKIKLYGEVKTKLTSLKDAAAKLVSSNLLTPSGSDNFEDKSVTSSATDIVSATATSSATAGTYSVLVNRLATYDTILSNSFDASDVTISGLLGGGTKTFTFSVGGEGASVSVTLTGAETNEEVIDAVVSGLNSAGLALKAQKITPTTDKVRLMITGTNTGSASVFTYADTSGGLFAELGLTDPVNTARTAYTNTTAGFSVTTSANLDASFLFNGIDITRSSNTVSDLISGVTLTLKKAQLVTDTPVTVDFAVDKAAVRKKVEDFFKSYNDTISSFSDLTKNGGKLERDPGVEVIKNKLISIISSTIDSISTTDGPERLPEIGAEISEYGLLSLKNKDVFDDYLSQNVKYVSDIFVSTEESGFIFEAQDGLAYQLRSFIESINGLAGPLQSQINISKSNIKDLDRRIQSFETKVDRQVQRYRDSFIKSQQALQKLTQQSQFLSSFNQNLLK
ncbi:MAG: flagellar filament capping protein FliD [Ignavibacteriales bacterium]|nr:flagellar filament capping protein FliD [Ignavibacteriales bacterium]